MVLSNTLVEILMEKLHFQEKTSGLISKFLIEKQYSKSNSRTNSARLVFAIQLIVGFNFNNCCATDMLCFCLNY